MVQTDHMFIKFPDTITIHSNFLRNRLPEVWVLNESQSVVWPKILWFISSRFELNIYRRLRELQGLGFRLLKLVCASGLASKFAPSRLTLSAVFQSWETTQLPSLVPSRKLVHQICGVKFEGLKVLMILVNPSSTEFLYRPLPSELKRQQDHFRIF